MINNDQKMIIKNSQFFFLPYKFCLRYPRLAKSHVSTRHNTHSKHLLRLNLHAWSRHTIDMKAYRHR